MSHSTGTSVPAVPTLSVIDGKVTTTSTDVATYFDKRHDNVLSDICELVRETPEEFNTSHFVLFQYTDKKGVKRFAYRLTRDGFSLLAMGFSDNNALIKKLAYINAFHCMETSLSDLDVRTALIDGLPELSQPLPAELNSLIDDKAWAMTHEVYDLLRVHLQRQVAYRAINSRKEVDTDKALSVIDGCDLGRTLTQKHNQVLKDIGKLGQIIRMWSEELLTALNVNTGC